MKKRNVDNSAAERRMLAELLAMHRPKNVLVVGTVGAGKTGTPL